jgi:hypothetical protein
MKSPHIADPGGQVTRLIGKDRILLARPTGEVRSHQEPM